MEKLCKLCDEKVVILEQSKDAEIQNNVKPHPSLCLFLRFSLSDEQSTTPRAERSESDEQKEPPIPPAIEHITRHYNESVLQPQLVLRLADEAVENKPVEQEHYRQEEGELDGVEEHSIIFGCKNTTIINSALQEYKNSLRLVKRIMVVIDRVNLCFAQVWQKKLLPLSCSHDSHS